MANKNTTRLFNKTDKIMEIREFRGIFIGKDDFISNVIVEAGKETNIDSKKYGGEQLSNLKIFCDGSYLRSSGADLLLRGDKFINYKTVIIEPAAEDQNSTGVVNYTVETQPRLASLGSATSLKVSRDSVLDHDYGWSVQFINGSVKLTREEGVTMILDPSKLFARINDRVITSLLCMVLNFWPRTFADLHHKVDLKKTVDLVNEIMVEASKYNALEGKVAEEVAKKVAKVIEKLVSDLDNLCVAKVEWYRPLFPGMDSIFQSVVGQMAEVDREKLRRFTTAIEPLLRPPNSLPGSSS